MSKATARTEIAALAERHGFEVKHTHGALVAYYHRERNEGFQLSCDGDAFDIASWHAPTEYVTKVDRRKAGERGARDGLSLVSDAKRRSVGMSEVRAEMRTNSRGMEIGYLDLKRRIRDKDWRRAK